MKTKVEKTMEKLFENSMELREEFYKWCINKNKNKNIDEAEFAVQVSVCVAQLTVDSLQPLMDMPGAHIDTIKKLIDSLDEHCSMLLLSYAQGKEKDDSSTSEEIVPVGQGVYVRKKKENTLKNKEEGSSIN